MARIVGRTRQREGVGLGMKMSETIIMILVVVALLAGVRYYFVVYRASPGFALGEYLGAVKAGKVDAQYAMLDTEDIKNFFPTQSAYEKGAKQSRGYTSRITNVTISEPKPMPKNPKIVTMEATVSMRGLSTGQALYQTGDTKDYKNTFTLRQDAKGTWKVWLSRSVDKMEMLSAEANPPVTSFN
jgi:ketosteroid isomerase-like protein